MSFLDEEIAKLQKQSCRSKKYKEAKENENEQIVKEEVIKELTQEEVILAIKNGLLEYNEEKLIFETNTYIKGKINIPIIKDFFDKYEENDSTYCLVKKHVLSIFLIERETQEDNKSIDNIVNNIQSFYKKNSIYTEVLEKQEESYKTFNKYIVSSKTSTALDYIYQYMLSFNFNNSKSIMIIFTCLEKERDKWEKIIKGISELIYINEGDN